MEKWKFKSNASKQGGSDGFWYDLTDGGYIKPEAVLDDSDQLARLTAAVDLVKSFETALEEADLLEEF